MITSNCGDDEKGKKALTDAATEFGFLCGNGLNKKFLAARGEGGCVPLGFLDINV